MSFDPKSVLSRIRSQKKKIDVMDASRDLEDERREGSIDRDSRSEFKVEGKVMTVMAEQIKFMQDRIKRLETELSEAHG